MSNNGGGSFDNEMKKYGLTNDLKKLDSFNQFIENNSPRQNSCSFSKEPFAESL